MKKVKLPLDLIYKCKLVEFIFSQCSVTVKLNLDKKGGKLNKTYARSSFLSANFLSVVYGSGAHNQQKAKYKQLLNLTVSLGRKVVSTRHPQPWQKKGGRNNGFQGEMIGGCPINLQQESHWGIVMLCAGSFWYFTSCASPITAMFVGPMVLILVHESVFDYFPCKLQSPGLHQLMWWYFPSKKCSLFSIPLS